MYKTKNLTGENLLGKIPVQTKGKTVKKFSTLSMKHSVKKVDLKNFIQDGNFIIDQEKTDLNNIKWSKEQEKEEILKENRIYFIDSHRNDYTEVIAVDNGEMYQFSYMEPYIGRRLKIDVNEGEYIIAKDVK